MKMTVRQATEMLIAKHLKSYTQLDRDTQARHYRAVNRALHRAIQTSKLKEVQSFGLRVNGESLFYLVDSAEVNEWAKKWLIESIQAIEAQP